MMPPELSQCAAATSIWRLLRLITVTDFTKVRRYSAHEKGEALYQTRSMIEAQFYAVIW